jgi:hypothetical protein
MSPIAEQWFTEVLEQSKPKMTREELENAGFFTCKLCKGNLRKADTELRGYHGDFAIPVFGLRFAFHKKCKKDFWNSELYLDNIKPVFDQMEATDWHNPAWMTPPPN